jgi:hypothetical protein
MTAASRLTAAQLNAALERERDGRPDKAAMSNEQRREAGLMTRRQAAEHEHLAALPVVRLAERVRGPVPDDPWASDEAMAWRAWQSAGHLGKGCEGWLQDFDDRIVCACGEVVLLLAEAS